MIELHEEMFCLPFASVGGVGLVLEIGLPDGRRHGSREEVGIVPCPVPDQMRKP